MSEHYDRDLEKNRKWCYNFMRVLLARQEGDSSTYRLAGTADEYEIQEVSGEERGWKIRAVRMEPALPTVITKAEGSVFFLRPTPLFRMKVEALSLINSTAFVHRIVATMSGPSDDMPFSFTVTVSADNAASRTHNWCLEHDRVSKAASDWFVFTDTDDEWLIKTTRTAKKTAQELYPEYGRMVGRPPQPATNVPKHVMETREREQPTQGTTQQSANREHRGGGLPPGTETR